jgi:hypothetical protein
MTRPLILLAALGVLLAGAPRGARAQTDTTATPRVKSTVTRTAEERDRFELGGGLVRDFFDVVGSFGYRRFLTQGPVFEANLMGEVTGTGKEQLTEGALGVYVLLRPIKTYKESWRVRPLLEAGPAVHIVVQGASLEGLEKTRYKAKVYIKTHPYVGFEALLTPRLGLVVRGRASIPSHRPFDYAQAAILFR